MSVQHGVPLIVVISKPSFCSIHPRKKPNLIETCCRAPQDPRMAGATLATRAIQDSNATQGTQATTLATHLATLDTHLNKEVQVQGLDFLPR